MTSQPGTSGGNCPAQVASINGGVPPFGHGIKLRKFIDPDVLQFDEVTAAAGAWNDVSPIAPNDLVRASGAAASPT